MPLCILTKEDGPTMKQSAGLFSIESSNEGCCGELKHCSETGIWKFSPVARRLATER